jgi:hypothetical protein
MQRIRLVSLCTTVLAFSLGLAPQAIPSPLDGPTVYIAPSGGFEVSIAAAIQKRHVPVQLVTVESEAEYVLAPSAVEVHKESGTSKLVRCVFAYCAGIEDTGAVSVQLVERSSHRVAWAYQVAKQRPGGRNRQSMAEAIAKHMKKEVFQKSF